MCYGSAELEDGGGGGGGVGWVSLYYVTEYRMCEDTIGESTVTTDSQAIPYRKYKDAYLYRNLFDIITWIS